MCVKESVHSTFKNRGTFRSHDPYQNWKYSFETMMHMIVTQSTGVCRTPIKLAAFFLHDFQYFHFQVPNGNHGLFHRFGIEAVTMEGFSKSKDRSHAVDLFELGRILEGLFRSLNNLLERFHQSFFFYILPAPDKFVSIGLYIPIIMCLGGVLFVKPCAHWYQLHGDNNTDENSENKDSNTTKKKNKNDPQIKDPIDLVRVGVIVLLTHTIGICIMNSPKYLTQIGLHYGYGSDVSVYYGFAGISLILLLLPFLIPGNSSEKNMQVLNIFANLEMGTSIIAIGMMNFSLALFCGVLCVPIILFIIPKKKS